MFTFSSMRENEIVYYDKEVEPIFSSMRENEIVYYDKDYFNIGFVRVISM